jgi:hypothetical protein
MLPRKKTLWTVFGLFMILAAACSPVVNTSTTGDQSLEASNPTEIPPATPAPEIDGAENEPTPNTDQQASADNAECNPTSISTAAWPNTDFCQHSIDYLEIFSGGVPKDGIPAIDQPNFWTIEESNSWLGEDWPIVLFELDGEARGYPLAVLIWHEIVNDVVAGTPISITFCPLCNSTIVFDRTLPDGTILDFGTTGNLRNSDLVMYDRQTESWWQQFTGEAIVGELTGTQLAFLPSQIISWADYKARFPGTDVLSPETGFNRSYGNNPYSGYDDINSSPWFPLDEDPRLPPMERVSAIEVNGIAMAYPFTILSEVGVINDRINDQPLVILWSAGTRTTFGNSSKDVGSTAVFDRVLNGQELTFEVIENGYRDLETGSTWNILGEALSGPLQGETLAQVVSAEHFWFAWSVFKPESRVWEEFS